MTLACFERELPDEGLLASSISTRGARRARRRRARWQRSPFAFGFADRADAGERLAPGGWEHIAAIGRRSFWDPRTVLVIGAGPIGLVAALIGVQHGGDVHVLDQGHQWP